MKKIALSFGLLIIFHYSFGQNSVNGMLIDTTLEDLMPSDFESFWLYGDGCGEFILKDIYTPMDTFRFFYRQPFSQYLLGDYYCGKILNIDSITTKCPYVNATNDSILFVYALFEVKEQYVSPYNKELYYSPIPSDVTNDSIDNYRYLNSLYKKIGESPHIILNVCIMMTKEELKKCPTNNKDNYTKEILLRMTDVIGLDSLNIAFCPQPFLNGYSTKELRTKKMIAKYWLYKYFQLYYEIYGREFPEIPITHSRETVNDSSKKQQYK